MRRDEAAALAWSAVYGLLSEDRTGLANTLLARAEAQVLRLSMLYALLDESAVIRHEHLNAALALWEYTEESAAYIFGQAIGDETIDTLLHALEHAGEGGLTKNYLVQEVFQHNTKASEVTRALYALEKQGRIVARQQPTIRGKGRAPLVYAFCSNVVDVVNVVCPSRYLSASNDAVKMLGQTTYPRTWFVRGLSSAADDEPGGCLHEHLNDAGHCNDCGELISAAETPVASAAPPTPPDAPQESTDTTAVTEASAPAPRDKPPLRHAEKGTL